MQTLQTLLAPWGRGTKQSWETSFDSPRQSALVASWVWDRPYHQNLHASCILIHHIMHHTMHHIMPCIISCIIFSCIISCIIMHHICMIITGIVLHCRDLIFPSLKFTRIQLLPPGVGKPCACKAVLCCLADASACRGLDYPTIPAWIGLNGCSMLEFQPWTQNPSNLNWWPKNPIRFTGKTRNK